MCGAPHPSKMPSAGLSFIQARTATVAEKVLDPDQDAPQLLPDDVLAEHKELAKEIENLKKKLNDIVGEDCCQSCQETPRGPARQGHCAAFGDPHFTTFDGAHTILLKEQTLWLVKSQNIWIQGVSQEATGDLMGIAVGGPFMSGHTLVIFNSSVANVSVSTERPFTVLFDGKPILDTWDEQGGDEFSEPQILLAQRRTEWNSFLHDKHILNMEAAIEFDVGNWSSRFHGKPSGGLYLFRLPEGVEITTTGVDLMSAVIKMSAQDGGQSGYCGNFNGIDTDEFEPAAPGSVPEELMPAWNTPIGEDLGPVPDEHDIFKNSTSAALEKLLSEVSAHENTDEVRAPTPCPEDVLAKAESQCSQVEDEALHAACIIDVCNTGSPDAADAAAAIGILQDDIR